MTHPPHDIEAERATLGAMLINQSAIYRVIEVLGQAPERFYLDQHQHIYRAFLTLMGENIPPDVVTLKDALTRDKKLDAAGGIAYLTELSSVVPTSANAQHYAGLVLDAYAYRSIIDSATRAVRQSMQRADHWREITAQLEKSIFDVVGNQRQKTLFSIQDTAGLAYADFERQAANPHDTHGLRMGFRVLDEMTGGLQPSEMVVLAARPSVGKTALSLNMAMTACRAGKGVMFFSLEMSHESLTKRLLCAAGGAMSNRVIKSFLAGPELQKLKKAVQEVQEWPLWIEDQPGISMLEIKAKALWQASKAPVDLVIVDYLQLVAPPRRNDSRQVEVAAISGQMKQLARELRCPVLALSQLSRGNERREDAEPRLSDLRDSGAIEQDADVVLMLWPGKESITHCKIAKQRNGPCGVCNLVFDKDRQRFNDAAGSAAETQARSYAPPPDNTRVPYADNDYEDDPFVEEEALF